MTILSFLVFVCIIKFFFISDEFNGGKFDSSIKNVENSIAYIQIPFKNKTADPQDSDIFLINTISLKKQRLNNDSYQDRDLSWNRLGNKLLFTSRRRATKHLSLNPTILCIYDFTSGTERILENAISDEILMLELDVVKQGIKILKNDEEYFNTSDPYWIDISQIGFLRRLPFGKGSSIPVLCTSDIFGKQLKVYRDWTQFPKWKYNKPQWINQDSVLVRVYTPDLDNHESRMAIFLTKNNDLDFLTIDSVRAFSPFLSYDKKNILFTRIIKNTTELVLMKLQTKEIKLVLNQPIFNAILSPHCNKIAFLKENGIDNDIYIMNIDGTNMKQITFDGGIKGSLAWSPNSFD